MEGGALSQNGSSAMRPSAGSGLSPGRPGSGDPSGSPIFRRLGRIWATHRNRRRLFYVGCLVVVAAIVGFGTLWISSMSGKSQSYWDGYSAGGTAYGVYGSESAQQACTLQESQAPRLGGRPPRDNPSQWIEGCVAAFTASAQDN